MAETTADVRRDIELTRERVSNTLAQLERKLNLTQIVRDNPWPAIGVAVGAGLLLSGSQADVKAAAATAYATKGAGARLAPALDDIVARLMQEVTGAFHGHVDALLGQVKEALGAPNDGNSLFGQPARGFASQPSPSGPGATHDGAHHQANGGMHAGTTPDVGHGGAGNPWSSPAGDANRANYTPSSAGSQGMHGA